MQDKIISIELFNIRKDLKISKTKMPLNIVIQVNKILFKGMPIILQKLTCWISRIQYGGLFKVEPLVTICQP